MSALGASQGESYGRVPKPGLPQAAGRQKQKIVLLVGLPGSGKSTWVAEKARFPLSSDYIRGMLTDDPACQSRNREVFLVLRSLLRRRLRAGVALTYVDATNLTVIERRAFINIARKFDCEIEAVFFDVPLEICRLRNSARDRVVPSEAMERLAAKLKPPDPQEGFSRVIVVRNHLAPTASPQPERQPPGEHGDES